MAYACAAPVLLVFFNRPDTFRQVFEKTRRARPKILFLAQDGPRSDADLPGIEACRKIADGVDWDCKVTKLYSETNLGCGMRPQSAFTAVLREYDRVIILEDDCVPSETYFPYCEELLERYKDDERIAYISGLNHFETWDCGESDYFFTRAGAIAGWATWRRAWRHYDYFVQGVDDPYTLKLYESQVADADAFRKRLTALKRARRSQTTGEKLSYWDTQWGFAQYTQNLLAIVPRINQISNIGVGAGATHFGKSTETKFIKYKNFVFIPTHKFEFPLRHPKFCAPDVEYHKTIYKCARGSLLKRIAKRILRRP